MLPARGPAGRLAVPIVIYLRAVKTRPAAALVLLLAAVVGLAAPVVTAAGACVDEAGAGCCGFDCALCLCCAHGPKTTASDLQRRVGGDAGGRVRPDERTSPPEPLPRDVLHVPKAAPVR